MVIDESARIAALHSYEILDTAPEQPYERLAQLVRTLLGVPMAAITFIDADRQFLKARPGLGGSETPRAESFCQYTIQGAEPLMIPDTSLDARVWDKPVVTGDPFIASYLGIPLVNAEGYALGSLCAMHTETRIYSSTDIETLRNLASLVVDWLEMRRMANCDFLTGAMTRRSMLAEMDREIVRFQRYGRPCAVAIFDLDRFKSVNDTYGHPVGDELLKAVAAACRKTLRSGDLFGRLGGEEFGLLLPETDTDEALQTAERFRAAIEEIRLPGHPAIRPSASFGVAPFSFAYKDPEQWIAAADGELYRAKREGRNRCCLKAA